MHSKIPGRYLIIPFLYLAIIASLLYAHFGGTTRVRIVAGNIELTSAGSTSDVTVAYGSMRFVFGGRGVILVHADESVSESPLASYRTEEDTLFLTFDPGVTLALRNGSTDASGFDVEVADRSVAAVGLPVSSSFERPDARAPLFVDGATIGLFPIGSRLAETDSTLFVPLVDSKATATLHRFFDSDSSDDPLYYWLSERFTFPTEREVDLLTTRFLDAVYAGWSSSRFSATDSTFRLADGRFGFDETAFAYLVSESLHRGTFRNLYLRILQISRAHYGSLTYRSAPLLGDVVGLARSIQVEDERRIDGLRTLLAGGDSSVFTRFDLLPFVFDRAPYTMAEELSRLASSLDPPSVSPGEAVGAMSYLIEAQGFDASILRGGTLLERFVELVMPFVTVTHNGLYLVDREGSADIGATIRAGVLLEGLDSADSINGRIARALLRSGLARADTQGFIPARIDPESGATSSPERLAPESIYELFTTNPYLPREISLFSTDGPGIWVYTAAGGAEVAVTDESYSLSFEFPVGSAHHVIFRGIEPFTSVTMFGIPWKSDPLFQNYTSGWTYVAESKTLYLKITHRTFEERIVIRR